MATTPVQDRSASRVDPGVDPAADRAPAREPVAEAEADPVMIAVRPKPAPAPTPNGRRLNDRYGLGEVLGHGSLGTTYRADDEVTGRPVVIKLVSERYAGDERFAERFMEAVGAAARLSHRRIARVLDAGEVDGRPFVVVEYVEGRSLRAVLAERGKLPIEQCAGIALQLADALGYAHRHYVAHGDLRPENVLLDARGDVVVVDFGLVRVAVAAERTLLGSAFRRVPYIPPEQLNQAVPDDRTDVYALGVLVYELLTGATPTSAREALAGARRPGSPLPPRRLRPEVPWRVDRAVMCAISSDPSDGFVSVREFRMALAGRPTSLTGRAGARGAGLPGGAPRPARRLGGYAALPGQVRAWLAVFLALAFAAATVFAALPRGQETDAPTDVPAAVGPEASPDNGLRPGSDLRQAVGAEMAPAGTREP